MIGMKKVNYWRIIQKYMPTDSLAYSLYVPHVVQVAARAIRIGEKLGMSKNQLQFIEEAAMLHDIGVVKVDAKDIGCIGSLPYMRHMTEGRKILEKEGLPEHARVCETHTGTGITKKMVKDENIPLPEKDYIAESIEDEILSYCDLFYSKDPSRLWKEYTVKEIRELRKKYGEEDVKRFNDWVEKFEG